MTKSSILSVQRANVVVNGLQQLVEIPLFTLMTSANLRLLFETTAAKFILLPAIALMMVIKGVLASIAYFRAKNKNVGKLVDLLIHNTAGVLVAISVAGFLALPTVFALAGPVLFLVAIGLNALYALTMFGMSIYKSLKRNTPDSLERHIHQKQIFRYGMGFLIGSAILIAVGGLFVSPIGIVGMSVIATIALVATIVGLGFNGKALFQKPEDPKTPKSDVQALIPKGSEVPSLDRTKEHRSSFTLFDFYHQKHRDHTVTQLLAQDAGEAKTYLQKEINALVVKFTGKINAGDKSQVTADKLALLQYCKDKLERGEQITTSDVKRLKADHPGAVQSFFRKVGDVEDTINAVAAYAKGTIDIRPQH